MEIQAKLTTNNSVLHSLSETRRRYVLELLQDRTSPVGIRELGTHLAANEQNKPLIDVDRQEVQAICTDLVHIQLPQLEAANLISWNQEKQTITTTDHPALSDPKLQQMVSVDAENWDGVLANIAFKRRRSILSILKDHDGAMARAELAKAVIAREDDAGDADESTDDVDDLLAELHHIHLPKLQQAGLITYDTADGLVTYTGHPALEDEWLDFREDETPRAILPSADHSDNIWTIEGRDNVIARGQSLFEQADEELFLMFTTDGLLEDGCIRRLQDAIDRGVDVYLGSQTPEVRDLVRERIPEAVIWEPQMDWLNLPPEHEMVGRLVFADREAIMLATLGEKTDDGIYTETAITGAGENNPLIVLIREQLGSRLDHLDAQSEEFLSELPL